MVEKITHEPTLANDYCGTCMSFIDLLPHSEVFHKKGNGGERDADAHRREHLVHGVRHHEGAGARQARGADLEADLLSERRQVETAETVNIHSH
jgi:hypothetical protein